MDSKTQKLEATLTDLEKGSISADHAQGIIEELYQNNEKNLGDAIHRVCEEIKNDEDYRISWEANIAMAFKDAFDFSGHPHDNEVVHEVANKAAAAFLDQLIDKDMGDTDGVASLAKLHAQAKSKC